MNVEERIKCSKSDCEFCVQGKKERYCIVNADWEHSNRGEYWTEDALKYGFKIGDPKDDHEFLSLVYNYEGNDYKYLPKDVIYSVCVDNYCLDMLSIYRKISFVLQCIDKNKNVESWCSDGAIERKVAFYYLEMRMQTGGEWFCDIPDCSEPPTICHRKAYRHFTEELYRLEQEINAFKLYNFAYCFCRGSEWWNSFREVYDRIMNYENRR